MLRHIILSTLLSLTFIPCVAANAPPVKFAEDLAEAKTVADCGKLLQRELHGLTDLLMTVKDDQTLTAAAAEMTKSSERTGQIAARLKTLPVPSSEERAGLSKEMQAADAADQKAKVPAMKAHLAKMPAALRTETTKQVKAYYTRLDAHGAVFSQYFRPDAKPDAKK